MQTSLADNTEILCDVQKLHKETLRNSVLNSTQASSLLGGQSIKEVILNRCYTPLSISVGESACLEENIALETLEAVIYQEFAADHGGRKVMLCGGVGMGKTTTVEKLIWDWNLGTCLQHYTLLLPLCVRALCAKEQSLESLILSTHPHLTAEALGLFLQRPHSLLLVLDGLDQIQNLHSESPPSGTLVSDSQQPAEGTVLLHSLLEGSLLPGASILLTSREALPLDSLQCVYLLGFSKAQKRTFFQQFFKDEAKAEQVLHHSEQAVGVVELCVCPAFCWTLCCMCREHMPETLTELYCVVTHTLLQEHGMNVEKGKQFLCGLGKLAHHCISVAQTHCSFAEVIACGLQPFLGSSVFSAFLRVSGDGVSSSDAVFSFFSPVYQEFFLAAAFYADEAAPLPVQDECSILEDGPEQYSMFLAGLSDPAQRKLLETSVGMFSSGRLSEFHSWLMSSVTEVLPGYQNQKHWRVFILLHHAHSPTLVRESIVSCTWRKVSYEGLQGPDCVALGFVVRCLGEVEELNLYHSALTDEQAEKLIPALHLTRSLSLQQSRLSVGVITHLARAMTNGLTTWLDLSSSRLGDEALKILCPAIVHSNLHTLKLRACALTPACSEVLGKTLSASKLCVLDLGGNDLQDQGLTHLISALGTSTCRLQELSFDMCSLSAASIAMLSSAVTSSLSELKKLNICRNNLANDTLELMSQALMRGRCSLHTLSFYDCELTDSCCPSIAAVLQSDNCCLTELELSANELGQSGGLLICDALKSPKCTLEKLCMSRCELTEEVFSALGSVLMSDTSRLKELHIGVNPVGDGGAKHMWKALKHSNCRLLHLDLEMVNLTDASVDDLCEAVAASSSLTTLILKNNNLTDTSIPRMVKLIQDHPTMEEFNLQYNDFSEDYFELMDSCPNIRY